MRSSLLLLAVLLVNISNAFHDSLNFVLAPRTRQCFFENFEATSPTRTIEAFVQSGGNADVWLTIHGPLGLQEIRDVNYILYNIVNLPSVIFKMQWFYLCLVCLGTV